MSFPTGATMRGVLGMGGAGMDTAEADEALTTLADELWLEREAVEQLLYALTNEQLILRAGAARWLSSADAKLRAAIRAVAGCELRRAVASTALADVLGLPGESTLGRLADAAPVPWDLILGDHLDALRDLLADLAGTEAEVAALLRAGPDAVTPPEAHAGDPGLGQAATVAAYASAAHTLTGVLRRSALDFTA